MYLGITDIPGDFNVFQILFLFGILLLLSLICTIANQIWTSQHKDRHWYLAYEGELVLPLLFRGLDYHYQLGWSISYYWDVQYTFSIFILSGTEKSKCKRWRSVTKITNIFSLAWSQVLGYRIGQNKDQHQNQPIRSMENLISYSKKSSITLDPDVVFLQFLI